MTQCEPVPWILLGWNKPERGACVHIPGGSCLRFPVQVPCCLISLWQSTTTAFPGWFLRSPPLSADPSGTDYFHILTLEQVTLVAHGNLVISPRHCLSSPFTWIKLQSISLLITAITCGGTLPKTQMGAMEAHLTWCSFRIISLGPLPYGSLLGMP